MTFLHGQPVSGFPVSPYIHEFMNAANGDFSQENFKEYVLMDRFHIHSKREAWEIIQENKHKLKQDTLIHGDFCLPNVILDNWKFSSFIDFSQAGIGDKHVDLFWAIWSLQYNLKTDKYTDYFLDLYGRDDFYIEMLRTIAAFEAIG